MVAGSQLRSGEAWVAFWFFKGETLNRSLNSAFEGWAAHVAPLRLLTLGIIRFVRNPPAHDSKETAVALNDCFVRNSADFLPHGSPCRFADC